MATGRRPPCTAHHGRTGTDQSEYAAADTIPEGEEVTKTIQKKSVLGLIGTAAGLAGLLLAAAPTGAAAATADTSAAAATKHCVVLVGKAPADGGASPELYRYCSNKSAADARAHLKSSDALSKSGGRSIQATALMEWYSDHNYGGNQTTVYGDYGPCDGSGYSLRPDSYWSANLTSARGYGTCTVAVFHNRALNYAATGRLPVPNVGGALNDNVGLIQVYYG